MRVLELFRLDGKTALVTGCRRGIGKAFAVALAEAGSDIVGVSKTLEPHASAIEKEVTALGRKFRGYRCDLANRDAVRHFAAAVNADFPIIDILVNNAGTILRKPAAEHPDEYWDEVIQTNLNSQFLLSREIGKRMLERGSGKIIFTASVSGRHQRSWLCCQQRGAWPTDQGSGERMGSPRCSGERHRSRLFQHRQHRPSGERSREGTCHPVSHSCGALG